MIGSPSFDSLMIMSPFDYLMIGSCSFDSLMIMSLFDYLMIGSYSFDHVLLLHVVLVSTRGGRRVCTFENN